MIIVFLKFDIYLIKYSNKNYIISYNVKENTLAENIIDKYFDAYIQLIENLKVLQKI